MKGRETQRTPTNKFKAQTSVEQTSSRPKQVWNKQVQGPNKCGMSTLLLMVVGSCTSSTCSRAGILRQAQSACSMTCSCLLGWWRASPLGTGYTSCLCCHRRRLFCGPLHGVPRLVVLFCHSMQTLFPIGCTCVGSLFFLSFYVTLCSYWMHMCR